MLLTITAEGQERDLLPQMLGMDPRRQYQVAIPGSKATLYVPYRADTNSHLALFVEIDSTGLPAGQDGGLAPGPLPSAGHLAAAIRQGCGLGAEWGRVGQRNRSAIEVPLRVNVRNLYRPGNLAQAGQDFYTLGWDTRVTRVPFGDLPVHLGDTDFLEFTLEFSERIPYALERLSELLPLLAPRHRAGSAGGYAGPVPLSRLVARFGNSGGYSSDDGVYWPRQGLAAQRIGAVLAVLEHHGVRTAADLGCGRGDLLAILAYDSRYTEVVGVDIDEETLKLASERLRLDWLPRHRQAQVRVTHGSVLAPDPRLRGFDAAILMEMLEHLDPPDVRLAMEAVLGDARPRVVLVTMPNAEHTVRFPGLGQTGMRHPDHKFEWTRSEFATWVQDVASAYGYAPDIAGIGSQHSIVGAPTQMALFVRREPLPER